MIRVSMLGSIWVPPIHVKLQQDCQGLGFAGSGFKSEVLRFKVVSV